MGVTDTDTADAGAVGYESDSAGVGGEGDARRSTKQANSCKGCLYYSSVLKSEVRNPRCVGLTRSLKQVPGYTIGESEMEATKVGRSLSNFKYSCIGYSVFLNNKDKLVEKQGNEAQLPFCMGLEFLVDRGTSTVDDVPNHAHKKEGVSARVQEPNVSHSPDRSLSSRFTRSAGLVASGVGRNLIRVGRSIKDSFEYILYDRSRPK